MNCKLCGKPSIVTVNGLSYCSDHAYRKVFELTHAKNKYGGKKRNSNEAKK